MHHNILIKNKEEIHLTIVAIPDGKDVTYLNLYIYCTDMEAMKMLNDEGTFHVLSSVEDGKPLYLSNLRKFYAYMDIDSIITKLSEEELNKLSISEDILKCRTDRDYIGYFARFTLDKAAVANSERAFKYYKLYNRIYIQGCKYEDIENNKLNDGDIFQVIDLSDYTIKYGRLELPQCLPQEICSLYDIKKVKQFVPDNIAVPPFPEYIKYFNFINLIKGFEDNNKALFRIANLLRDIYIRSANSNNSDKYENYLNFIAEQFMLAIKNKCLSIESVSKVFTMVFYPQSGFDAGNDILCDFFTRILKEK